VFDADMAKFCKEDGVTGVDVVLNSLSHDDYIPTTLKYLKKGGRFMEIGKRNVYTEEQMTAERPDVFYKLLALDYYMAYDRPKFNELLTRFLPQAEKGMWQPMPVTTFAGLEKGPDAFRYLQRAQQIGKVVITVPSRMDLKPDATYVLSGGMGSIGLLTARTLVEEGAKSVVLLSRSGKPASDAVEQWDWLQSTSAQVVSKQCDVGDAKAVARVVKEIEAEGRAPVRGAMHLAAVLDDALLQNLTPAHFRTAFKAKVEGAQNLHDALNMSALDFFVMFSSTTALVGSPGQGNYAAANAALDALAHYWQQRGEKVWSIQWGPWREAGMASQKGTVERLRSTGVGSLSNVFGMSMLASALGSPSSMLVAQPFRWKTYLQQFVAPPAVLSRFVAEARSGARDTRSEAAKDLSPEGILAFVKAVAEESMGGIVEVEKPLSESGMDSLSAVEFRNRLVIEYGVQLPNTLMFDHPTVASVAAYIAANVSGDAPEISPIVKLNDRPGVPLVLVPGALQSSEAFAGLAKIVPFPLWAIDWPLTSDGHDGLRSVARWAVDVLRKEQPEGPYFIGGHSIGGVLALEMAAQLEAAAQSVHGVVLLDTRTLPPFDVPEAPEGAKLPSQLEWQLRFLADHAVTEAPEAADGAGSAKAPAILLKAADLSAVGALETFLSAHFQDDETVLARLAPTGRAVASAVSVPGRHFDFYSEPQVGKLALQLCAHAAQLP
jgi:thioesterase domain-containing protein/NAD(P)-dependent dehydrogenase (short-subunit alcohol dehydrogenase family)/acyl carrier protein